MAESLARRVDNSGAGRCLQVLNAPILPWFGEHNSSAQRGSFLVFYLV